MRVAVTFNNDQVFQHFGHTTNFKCYDIDEGKVLREQVVDTVGQGHGALAGFLKELSADVLICGGIGGGAQRAMKAAGVELYAGIQGNADDAVKAFLSGTLPKIGEATCDHHHGEEHHHDHCHHHGDECGDHGCGYHEGQSSCL